MRTTKAVSCLCVLSALLIGGVMAQSAQAETTAFTCSKNVTTKTFSDAHCASTTGTKEYGHAAFASATQASGASGTFNSGKWVLKFIKFGITVELATEAFSASGSMENTTLGGEMVARGEGTGTFTGVTVIKPHPCKVFTDDPVTENTGEEGVIHTEPLIAQTTTAMGVKFEPKAGTILARFEMTGCTGSEALEALNTTYTVTGNVTGVPNGGEVRFTHAETTAQNTLKVNGFKAGLEGAATFKNSESGNALVATTPPYTTD